MSEEQRPTSRPGVRFDDFVEEARAQFRPAGRAAGDDWSDVDAALFARLARSSRPAAPVRRAVSPWTLASGVVLAAAAAVTLFTRPVPAPRVGQAPVAVATITAGDGLRVLAPEGFLRPRASGVVVGDRLETTTTAAFFSVSEGPDKGVAWRLDRGARLAVTHGRMPLALALEEGAVDADVDKVSAGEAFVVDVGAVRVAVRGTRLRVSRAAGHAEVDLSEGTIAIGPIPAAGLTEGTLISAPAHVSIDLSDPKALRIVRPAPAVPVEPHPPTPPKPSPRAAASSPPVAPPAPISDEALSDAVRNCIERSIAPKGTVRVTVMTTLILELDGAGAAKVARFEPPLAPDVQACAAETIYKARFASGATAHRITIVAQR